MVTMHKLNGPSSNGGHSDGGDGEATLRDIKPAPDKDRDVFCVCAGVS